MLTAKATSDLFSGIVEKLKANGVQCELSVGESRHGPFARIAISKVALIRYSSQEDDGLVEIHWDRNNQINSHDVSFRKIKADDFAARLVRDMTKRQGETFRLQGLIR